jgi:hypothetical protein
MCGDGIVAGTETCDEGPDASTAGCVNCVLQPGWTCAVPGGACNPTCGDKKVVGDEECDGGKGCSLSCTALPGFNCEITTPTGGLPTATCTAKCGDGLIVGDEKCDSTEGCDTTTCQPTTGWTCDSTTNTCTPICGSDNGVRTVDGDEECDNDSAGCSNCRAVAGWSCDATENTCTEVCGDGFVVGNEDCDSVEGCTECKKAEGWTCDKATNECTEDCNDGIVVGREECDPSTTDGCDSTTCTMPPPGPCGNGVLDQDEACDSTTVGCKADCTPKAGFVCVGLRCEAMPFASLTEPGVAHLAHVSETTTSTTSVSLGVSQEALQSGTLNGLPLTGLTAAVEDATESTASAVTNLGPDGAVFQIPVELDIEFGASTDAASRRLLGVNQYTVAVLDEARDVWTPIESTCSDSSCSANLFHFSKYAVIKVPDTTVSSDDSDTAEKDVDIAVIIGVAAAGFVVAFAVAFGIIVAQRRKRIAPHLVKPGKEIEMVQGDLVLRARSDSFASEGSARPLFSLDSPSNFSIASSTGTPVENIDLESGDFDGVLQPKQFPSPVQDIPVLASFPADQQQARDEQQCHSVEDGTILPGGTPRNRDLGGERMII